MATYVVVILNFTESDWLPSYGPPSHSLVAEHGGKVLAVQLKNSIGHAEGSGEVPTLIGLVEFPTPAQWQAFYDDPRYAPWKKLRMSKASGDLFVIEGG